MRGRVLDYEEAVLDVVQLIPAGKVLTYGDIAEILETGGPRQVGAVMSRGAVDVSWWRVVRAGGRPPQGLEASAVEHYAHEATPMRSVVRTGISRRPEDYRVDLSLARWYPARDEQRALQHIVAALGGHAPGSRDGSGLSEANDGVDP